MKRTFYILSFAFCLLPFVALRAQITVAGRVLDEKKEPMVGAVVAIYLNNVSVTGAQTDIDGNYRVNGLDPGTYDVEASLIGYATQRQTGVQLISGLNTVDFILSEKSNITNTVVIREYKIPIVKVDQTQQGQAFSSEQLKNSPLKNVNSIIASAAGVSSNSKSDEITIKGSRPGATDYYIDGVRVRNNYLPVADIEQLQVITGGLDARYGDVTGGIITITTKGPASTFTGGVEVESSKLFNKFNYNFVNANLAGPILLRDITSVNGVKSKEAIIGFRLSAQARLTDDALPPAIPVYQVKPDVLAKLQANPVTTIGAGTRVASAELLTADDFNALPVRPGNQNKSYNLNGKLDFKLAKDVNFAITGNYAKIDNQILPSGGSNSQDNLGKPWQVYDSGNNPWQYTNNYRFNARFRQRLGNTYVNANSKTRETGTVIENAQYTLQGGFEQNNFTTYDATHKDRLFDYGYIGQFNTVWNPFITQTPNGLQHVGYLSQLASYTRSEINPILANYNNDVNVNSTGSNLNLLNGIYNNTSIANVFGFEQNVGRVYNLYQKSQNNTITGNATVSFDLIPNGDKKNAHNIEFGFNYEQRNNKSYSINPFSLWDLAERLQNQNLNGTALDTTVVLRDTTIGGQKIHIYAPALNTDIAAQTDLGFYKNYRKKFGLAANSFGNVNNLTPDQMSLDLFTARELNEQRLINYNGYDYLGNPLASTVSFNDFFSAKDANGTRTFPVAANKPVYFAGYLQDKFRIGDLIVSAGVRIDRYDANNKVLKDPYSLYDIMTAKDFYTLIKQPKPDNIADDYKVYLTSNTVGKTNYPYSASDIRAFRQGDTWFTKNGQPQDPIQLFGSGSQPNAKYVVDTFTQIKQIGYDPSISFTDYKPQTNIMPRLSFSFPISDIANFFAHYDILYARPASNSYVSALDYYYFDDPNRSVINNANLRPERTTDYEVGFQQKVTENSGIKVAAYYKELKDMIQLVYYKYLPAPLSTNQYRTYGNADFGTVKGFTFQYDLRQINHFSALINYTLQFADGTGSDVNSQADLNKQGNIRTLSPLNFDERHRFSFTFDYRYNDQKYDGPMLFNSEVLSKAGINLQLTTVSGRPYTAESQPQPFGGSQIAGDINGTRLPWTYNLDFRIDKTITLNKTAKKPLNINIYFRVQNVLNTLNVSQVYTATGSASNDGYLTSPFGVTTLANTATQRGQAALQQYQVSYIQRLLNPDFYFLPRQMYLGATFDF